MPDLSVVIVNYNTREPLRRCLKSIQQQHGDLDVQVIVVDNGSRDNSPDMVRQEMPEAIMVEPGRNTWFSGGNNLGVEYATAEYLLVLNPDTLIQPNMFQIMLAYMKNHPRVGALTCQMRFPDGKLQSTCSRIPRYIDLLLGYTFLGVILSPWRDRRRTAMWYSGWERDSDRAVEVIPDSCMLLPTHLGKQIGMYDENLKLYFTEDDICKRIITAGYEVHFVADALVLHEEHASVSQVQRLASQVYFDDLIAFSRKYYGTLETLFLQTLMWPTRRAMDAVQRLRGERKAFQN
jgi:GT2 family glycosyltransferase